MIQIHGLITNLVWLSALGVCMFLSTDFYLPLVSRSCQVTYSSNYFFNYCLVVISLLPLSFLFQFIFNQAMGVKGERKTLFWSQKRPTRLAFMSVIVSTCILTITVLINLLGRSSSSHCYLNTG